jgi:hypothetical protein
VIVDYGNLTIASGITFDSDVSASFIQAAFPTTDFYGDGSYFGPNFEIAAVPEPSSLLLSGLTVLGMVAYFWRKQKRRAMTVLNAR